MKGRIGNREIAAVVGDVWSVTLAQMQGRSKYRKISRARQVAYWIAVRRVGHSFSDVARFYGRHHSSVMDGVSKVDRLSAADAAFATRVLGAAAAVATLTPSRGSEHPYTWVKPVSVAATLQSVEVLHETA